MYDYEVKISNRKRNV